MRGARAAIALGVALLATSLAARGQTGLPRRPPTPLPVTPRATPTPAVSPKVDDPRDMRARFGVELAQRLERSSDPDERLRALARASALGSPEGIAMLVAALDPTAPTRNDARAKIEVARGLAGHVELPAARGALMSILNLGGPATSARGGATPFRTAGDPFGDEAEQAGRLELARRTAALALAQAADPRATEALIAVARGGGPGQAAAANALTAFPPATLPLGTGAMTPSLLHVIGQLGDLRAIEAVRTAAHANDVATRAAAIVTMGEMGDARGVEIARAALAESDPRVRAAAAEALIALDAPEKGSAVEALLGDDATAAAGIRLAMRAHGDAIVQALATRTVNAADPALRAAAVVAIGRAGSAESVRALVALTKDALLQGDAADALARSPSEAAMPAIEAMAAAPASRRLAVRAYVVRALVRGERSGAMRDVIRELARARDAADRAMGQFARVALGEVDVASALADERDPAVRRAAAMASLARDDRAGRRALLTLLAKESDLATQQVLAVGLTDGDPDALVTTSALLDRAESGGGDAPLAAMAFARRAEAAQEGKLDSLLAARDPVLRAHVARGLGANPAPSAVGRLARAYTYEADDGVRRAIVLALATRAANESAPARHMTLTLAAHLDPDAGIRWSAQRALAGLGAAADDAGREVAWLRAIAEGASPPPPLSGALVRADGLAVPIAFDPDGYALVPGVPPGDARLVLAPKLPSAYSNPSP